MRAIVDIFDVVDILALGLVCLGADLGVEVCHGCVGVVRGVGDVLADVSGVVGKLRELLFFLLAFLDSGLFLFPLFFFLLNSLKLCFLDGLFKLNRAFDNKVADKQDVS